MLWVTTESCQENYEIEHFLSHANNILIKIECQKPQNLSQRWLGRVDIYFYSINSSQKLYVSMYITKKWL